MTSFISLWNCGSGRLSTCCLVIITGLELVAGDGAISSQCRASLMGVRVQLTLVSPEGFPATRVLAIDHHSLGARLPTLHAAIFALGVTDGFTAVGAGVIDHLFGHDHWPQTVSIHHVGIDC